MYTRTANRNQIFLCFCNLQVNLYIEQNMISEYNRIIIIRNIHTCFGNLSNKNMDFYLIGFQSIIYKKWITNLGFDSSLHSYIVYISSPTLLLQACWSRFPYNISICFVYVFFCSPRLFICMTFSQVICNSRLSPHPV